VEPGEILDSVEMSTLADLERRRQTQAKEEEPTFSLEEKQQVKKVSAAWGHNIPAGSLGLGPRMVRLEQHYPLNRARYPKVQLRE
jgi:hypothetical protein